ncbi:MAG: transglycosylase domain-containing protein, partial [Pseudomonadota bacterium]
MRKFLATIISAILHCIIIAMISFGVIIYYFSQDLPDYSELANYDPETMTRLYAADGKLLAEYAIEKRIYVPLTSIPKRVIQAFISAEDKDFYTNTGLDFRGIARAVRQNIEHLKGNNKAVAGGSTITQQVVKNFLLTPEKTLSRKIKEAILAFRITQVYSKDRILELYLNEIYLGKGSYGVAASALNYFNKPLDELTLEEAAFLAALPKTPGRSDLVQQKERRDYVINRMMDDGNITAAEAKAAIANPITMKSRDKTEMANGDFFAEEVRRQLQNKYGDNQLYKGGMFVKTTLNTELQKYAEDALRYALIEYDKRKGYRGPISHMDNYTNWQKQLNAVEARNKLPLFNGEKLALVYESTKTKASII